MALRSILLAMLPVAHAAGHLNFEFPETSYDPIQFEIKVNEDFIEETKLKAGLYRPSVDLQDDVNWNWIEGPPRANQTSLAEYWAPEYDWFKIQEEMNNNHSHWAITIEGAPGYEHGIPIHFVHEKSDREDAIPLLLLHGWPSTYLEWRKVLEPLTSPEDTDTQAFHFIAVDLPGFGFSPAPTHSGMGPSQMAHAFDYLMKTLGYEEYAVASTDAGWQVGMALAQELPESLIGHFCDFFIAIITEEDQERFDRNETRPDETAYMVSSNEWFTVHSSYMDIQSKAPLLAAQALTDTPVGFGGWVSHLQYPVSDGYEYSHEELITNTMVLWIQGTYGNLRAYVEFVVSSNAYGFAQC